LFGFLFWKSDPIQVADPKIRTSSNLIFTNQNQNRQFKLAKPGNRPTLLLTLRLASSLNDPLNIETNISENMGSGVLKIIIIYFIE